MLHDIYAVAYVANATLDIYLLIGVAGLVMTVAAFFCGKWTAAKSLGERWGRQETKMENLQSSFDEFKVDYKSDLRESRESNKDEIARLDKRIDAVFSQLSEHMKGHSK